MKRTRAFTLIELLVVVVIIAILASVAYGALLAAKNKARKDATRATIAKVNEVIQATYQKSLERRLPLDVSEVSTLTERREITTNARRDMARLEVPDRWSDVLGGPLVLQSVPSRSSQYRYRYDKAVAEGVSLTQIEANGSAELLYLVVMQGQGTALHLRPNEWGDVDGDGLREFHDGWGRPIRFIRWPAGFSDCPEASMRPLLYSAGPDGVYDIFYGGTYALVEGELDPFQSPEGWPTSPAADDNIHSGVE